MIAQEKNIDSKQFNLPKLGTDAVGNRHGLVNFYMCNSPFKTNPYWKWSSQTWDVKGICNAQTSKMQNSINLHFTRHNGLGLKVKTSKKGMKAFYSVELADLAKCHICSKQIKKPKSFGTLQQIINAYRYLDLALAKSRKTVEMISTADFKKAELLAQNYLAESTFYKVSTKLEEIQDYFVKSKLCKHKPNFKKTKSRSELKLPSDTRIDQKSIDSRNEKLPTIRALQAVAELSFMQLEGRDALLQSLTDILFATGLRFGEVISLDVDCLKIYMKEDECDITGRTYKRRVCELYYKPEKGGLIIPKEIPSKSLAKILIRAIKRVKRQLKDLRYEIELAKSRDYDYFPTLPNHEQVFVPDAVKLLNWSSSSNFIQFMKKQLFLEFEKKRNVRTGIKTKLIVTDKLKLAAQNQASKNIDKLSALLKKTSLAKSPEKLLFVQKFQENHSIKRALPWGYQLFTETEYRDFLGGRNGYNIKSIFQRVLNVDLHGNHALTSHKFRHYLNTLAQLSDSVSEIEIARYFGRKYMGDNETYDHTNPIKRVFDHAEDILNSTPLNADRAKEAFVMFPLVEREEVLSTIEDLSTTLVTSIGLCRHDFSESPCGKHYACLRGCAEYQRTKGDQTEIQEIQEILEQHKKHLAEAKKAVDSKYHGANQWLQSHQALIDGCKKALEIENNDEIQTGYRVNVFPDGNQVCEAA